MAKSKLAEATKNSDRQATMDRRQGEERRNQPTPVASERRKVQRRRQIDPTTCERDYSQDEIEFMQAMDAYKRRSGRMFPTCSEILEVIREIGYVRLTPDQQAALTQPENDADDFSTEDAEEEFACMGADDLPGFED